MIPLNRKQFPSSKADLAEALEQAAHRFIPKDGQLTELHSRVFPYIDEIAFNFDGARFDSAPPPFPKLDGNTSAAFEAGTLSLSARNIAIRGIPLNLRLEAHGLDLHRGQDENGDSLLVIHRVRDGILSVSFAQLDFENAIEKIAREQSRGLTIDRVRMAMRARGPRSIAVDVHIEARKLLFRARIDISGQIDISDDFVIHASNLKCKSDGGIGAIACTALAPVFRDLEEKRFSLSSLPLGNVRVRDVRVTVADTVEITADFGAAS
jgi:hypothetical protein